MHRGKFIAIEGIDGSGKRTQFDLLINKLRDSGRDVETFDFPRYKEETSRLVRGYLKGEYGEVNEVGPRKASIFYAVDRFGASAQILDAINASKIVLSNRYVASNLGHQGAKLERAEQRRKFFDWVLDLEYEILGISEPDLNIILHVPVEITQKLALEKDRDMHVNVPGDEKNVRDIHEDDTEHLRQASEVYLEISQMFPDKFKLVECAPDGNLLPREEIHNRIWELVKDLI